MRYGIFSDVHSNLEALEAVLAAYKREAIDRYLCIGDIIGYAANPHECLALVKETVSVCVAGNHDWAAVDKFNLEYFNPFAKAAVIKNAAQLCAEDKDYLANLGLVFKNEDLILAHGSLDNAASFNYLESELEAEPTFRLMESDICFVGHTHIPQVFEFKDKFSLSRLNIKNFNIRKGNKYIVNVGSVGQPRDRDPRASYCIFDTSKREVSLKRVAYDFKITQDKILAEGYHKFLATRLSLGY